MKNAIYIVAAVLILGSCSYSKVVVTENDLPEDIFYLPNEIVPFPDLDSQTIGEIRKSCVCLDCDDLHSLDGHLVISGRPSRGTAPEEDAERGELLGALRSMVARLSQGDRELVALYFAGGLSQEEIARELDMPQRTVSFRIR